MREQRQETSDFHKELFSILGSYSARWLGLLRFYKLFELYTKRHEREDEEWFYCILVKHIIHSAIWFFWLAEREIFLAEMVWRIRPGLVTSAYKQWAEVTIDQIKVLFMRFHEFSWKNIKLSKFVLFPVQIRDSSIIRALSWIFMKKYQTFKVRSFPSSDNRFKYYSCAFMNLNENDQSFKVRYFSSSDKRFKNYSCAFMNFHEKISNHQSSIFSKLRCEIQVLFVRFHEFS
jgi:hypothetical protein